MSRDIKYDRYTIRIEQDDIDGWCFVILEYNVPVYEDYGYDYSNEAINMAKSLIDDWLDDYEVY